MCHMLSIYVPSAADCEPHSKTLLLKIHNFLNHKRESLVISVNVGLQFLSIFRSSSEPVSDLVLDPV